MDWKISVSAWENDKDKTVQSAGMQQIKLTNF